MFSFFLALLPSSVTAWLQPRHEQMQVACSIIIAVLIVAEAIAVTRAAHATT